MFPPNLGPTLVVLGVFVMMVFIVWITERSKRERLQAKKDFHKQLLDKFGSGQEFAAFLETESSRRLLDDLGSEREHAKEKILRIIQAGIVLMFLGAGALAVAKTAASGVPRVPLEVLTLASVILMVLGLGFLISAALSYYLSKKWGLIQDVEPSRRLQRP